MFKCDALSAQNWVVWFFAVISDQKDGKIGMINTIIMDNEKLHNIMDKTRRSNPIYYWTESLLEFYPKLSK